MTDTPDRIVKEVLLRAPLARVWAAIADAGQFGRWFGIEFDGPFTAGHRVTGRIVPTTVDAEVARAQAPHTGKPVLFIIERIEPMSLFSYRWHPHAVDPNVDYALEPTTVVAFELTEVEGGTRLVISESGFTNIPLDRRAKAFESNDGGWSAQARLIAQYLERHPE